MKASLAPQPWQKGKRVGFQIQPRFVSEPVQFQTRPGPDRIPKPETLSVRFRIGLSAFSGWILNRTNPGVSAPAWQRTGRFRNPTDGFQIGPVRFGSGFEPLGQARLCITRSVGRFKSPGGPQKRELVVSRFTFLGRLSPHVTKKGPFLLHGGQAQGCKASKGVCFWWAVVGGKGVRVSGGETGRLLDSAFSVRRVGS